MNVSLQRRNDPAFRGTLFYDAHCARCARFAGLLQHPLARHGFHFLPLQTPGTPERLGVTMKSLSSRIHLLTAEGRRIAGADVFVEVASHMPWARPFVATTRFPGVMRLLRGSYDWVATHRYCFGGTCHRHKRGSAFDWLPLAIMPAAAFILRGRVADWLFMWALAFAIFSGCKWLSYRNAVAAGVQLSVARALGYLFAWVGMEPDVFVARHRPPVPTNLQWLCAFGRVALGAGLIWGATRLTNSTMPLVVGWIGMAGIVLLLHFGCFELLALAWRRAGIPVEPLMRAPLLATSLGDFWGARWNTGFHALAHKFLFRPLLRYVGKVPAVLGVFLISGLVHDLVITAPARGSYGLPTAYFLLQGFGLVLERSVFGRRLGLGTGIRGRAFTFAVAAAPVFWLFPPVFVHRIIVPMLRAIGAN